MVILMLYYPGYQPIIHIGMFFKVLIIILYGNPFVAVHIFAHFRNAQTAFVKAPLFTFFLKDNRINECLPEISQLLLLLFAVIVVVTKRVCIHYKKADGKPYL